MPVLRRFRVQTLAVSAALACLASCAAPAATGQQEPDPRVSETLERISEAYGGEALQNLDTVSINIDRRLAWPGQGQTAGFVEYVTDRQHKTFDLVNQVGSVERWILQNGNAYHNRYVVDGDGPATIDYFDMTVDRPEEGSYFRSFATDYRSSDTLMAYLLTTAPPPLTFERIETYRGEDFDVLSFEVVPETQRISAYVSRHSGLIKRAVMAREIGTVNIIFAAHREVDGVTYADESRIFLDDALVEYDASIAFTPNPGASGRIPVEAGLSGPLVMVDNTEMTVEEVGGGLYHVGQDGYSPFALNGDVYVAANPYAGLKDRYDALVASTGQEYSVSHVILTHHHSDHLAALDEAIGMGATLVVTAETEKWLRAERDDFEGLPLQVVRSGDKVGPFTIYVHSTNHVTDTAILFHRDSRAIYQDDHYNGLMQSGATRIQPSGLQLYEIITALDLSPSVLLSGHARKAEAWEVFAAAAEQTFHGNICPSLREICLDQQAQGLRD